MPIQQMPADYAPKSFDARVKELTDKGFVAESPETVTVNGTKYTSIKLGKEQGVIGKISTAFKVALFAFLRLFSARFDSRYQKNLTIWNDGKKIFQILTPVEGSAPPSPNKNLPSAISGIVPAAAVEAVKNVQVEIAKPAPVAEVIANPAPEAEVAKVVEEKVAEVKPVTDKVAVPATVEEVIAGLVEVKEDLEKVVAEKEAAVKEAVASVVEQPKAEKAAVVAPEIVPAVVKVSGEAAKVVGAAKPAEEVIILNVESIASAAYKIETERKAAVDQAAANLAAEKVLADEVAAEQVALKKAVEEVKSALPEAKISPVKSKLPPSVENASSSASHEEKVERGSLSSGECN